MPLPAETHKTRWLIRIPEVFVDSRREVLDLAGAEAGKALGIYQIVRMPAGVPPRSGIAGLFIPWCLPLDHTWPCDPGKTEGFVEKAATALERKFGMSAPRTVWVGTLKPGSGQDWFKRLASNLRGRCLQLFPESAMLLAQAGEQRPDEKALFCFVGREGLYAGLASPAECNGFYPGGILHLPRASATGISRAGAKIAEALHQAGLYGTPPGPGCHWLELGASPGGMTLELLSRGNRVTAIDRAALDGRLSGAKGLEFIQMDVAAFQPLPGISYDAMVCDMNGDPVVAFAQVLRLASYLRVGAWVFFTLKTTGSESLGEIIGLHDKVLAAAKTGGLRHLQTGHLCGNRREFTMWLIKPGP